MVKNIVTIDDFGEIINAVNTVIGLKGNIPDKETADKVKNIIMSVSEPVLNCSSKENEKIYSNLTLPIIDELGKNNSSSNINTWIDITKELLAVKFTIMSINTMNTPVLVNDDTERMLVDFFDLSDVFNIASAHLFAVLRFAHKDPKYCYDEIINTFTKFPRMIADIFNNISYIYSPQQLRDVIFEKCPICGGEHSTPYYCAFQANCNDSNFSPAKLWVKCDSCNNLYAYNFPVSKHDTVNGHYTKKDGSGILEIRNYLFHYSEIFNRIKQYNKGRKYLEVGIGNGEMLAVALEMGYDVSAVEICKEDCETISGALGVDIKWSDFADYETDKRFDVIVMGDVIEHVMEPIKCLEKAYSLLNDGGILWLSTPNYNSAVTRMRKFVDPMWNQKNHFTYFSYDGLVPFLEKIGFKVQRYDVSNRYNGSMELILQK